MRAIGLTLISLALSLTITCAWAGASAKRGKIIAMDACSACHQVTPDQNLPAPVFDNDEQSLIAAPSFRTIAIRYGNHRAWLKQFVLAPKHPMREQEWDVNDLGDVIAYIGSLRRHTKGWKQDQQP